METVNLAEQLGRVAILFAAAAAQLDAGDIDNFRIFYGRALRALDTYQDLQSVASE